MCYRCLMATAQALATPQVRGNINASVHDVSMCAHQSCHVLRGADDAAIVAVQQRLTSQLSDVINSTANHTTASVDTLLGSMTSIQAQMAALDCARMRCAAGSTCVVREFRAMCDCGGQDCTRSAMSQPNGAFLLNADFERAQCEHHRVDVRMCLVT